MRDFAKQFRILSAIIEAFNNNPETINYPHAHLVLPKGYRGTIAMVSPEKCSGCGLCIRDCPAQALELHKESREKFRLVYYPARCAYCGQCVESCRNHAISHLNQLAAATNDLSSSVHILKDTLDLADKNYT